MPQLMQTISKYPNGDYHFIESLENAGFVYGEIVYKYFYAYNKYCTSVQNGFIYDYINNQWVDTIEIESMPSGKERVWYIRRK